jgi:biofilm PGA synthesis lipoprotein PgaB
MKRTALRAGVAAGLICLFTAFCAFGQEVQASSPEEGLGLARTLMSEGRPSEALELLRLTQERFPEWHRTWELRVLQEACRQTLGLPTLSAEGAGDRRGRLRIAQVLLFEGEAIEDISANLVRLRDAGVNTVFIRVFHNHGDRPLLRGGPSARSGVYFQTDAAPVLEDYLSAIIPVCRRLGLSVFAWMTTRRCEWLLAERPDLAELTLDLETGKVLPSHSLNIFHPKVRTTLLEVFGDLAAYDIDGILFQDDLVMRTAEGLSPEAVGAYMEDGGGAVSPETLFRMDGSGPLLPLFSPDMYRPAFWDWVSWKNRRLLELAWELMNAARRVRPELRFALNLYYEAVLNPRMALAWYAQDLSAALGYPFDYFSLMSYHRQIGKELSLSGDEALRVLTSMSRRAVSEVGRPERVIMKIQSLDWDTHQLLPGDELDRALSAASPVEGVSLAFVRSSSDPPLDVIRKHFRPGKE